jgi:hypothetical protein
MVLIKPEMIRGKKSQLKLEAKGGIPREIEEGLREIYELHLAVHDRVPSILEGKNAGDAIAGSAPAGMRLDIGPPNLVWIEDPDSLKRFRMKRPGFFLFEVDQTYLNRDRFPTFESFRDEFLQENRR